MVCLSCCSGIGCRRAHAGWRLMGGAAKPRKLSHLSKERSQRIRQVLPALVGRKQRLRIREYTPWSEIWHAVAHQYPTRSILGFTLMVTQAFLYNAIFGAIVGTGSRTALFGAYCFAGAVMLVAAIVEVFLGVKAERQSLESIATPLSEVVQREPVPVT